MTEEQLVEVDCENMIKALNSFLDEMKDVVAKAFNNDADGSFGESEVNANLKLSFRHIEDAKMRLGNVIAIIATKKSFELKEMDK